MKNSFGKHSKKQIEKHETSIDAEALWENIEPALQADRRNRKWFVFFLFGITCLGAFCVFWMTDIEKLDTTERQSVIHEQVPSEKENRSSTRPTNDATSESGKHSSEESQNKSAKVERTKDSPSSISRSDKNTLPGKNSNPSSSIKSKPTLTFPEGAGTPIHPIIQDAQKSDAFEAPSIVNNKSAEEEINQTALIKPKPILTFPEGAKNSKEEKSNNPTSAATNQVTNNSELGKTFPEGAKKESSIAPKNPVNKKENLEADKNNSAIATQQSSDLAASQKSKESKIESSIDSSASINQLPNARKGWSTALYTAIGYHPLKREAILPENEALLNLRQSSEQSLEAIQLGVDVKYTHRSRLSFALGLEFYRLASIMRSNGVETSIDSSLGVVRIINNPYTGKQTEEMGMVKNTHTTTFDKRIYNYHRLINIPMRISYQWQLDQSWTLEPSVGAVFNISRKSEGQILDTSSTFYHWQEDSENRYRKNTTVQWQCGLRALRSIGERSAIEFGLLYRQGALLTTAESPIQEKFGGLSLQVGFRRYW